MNKILVFANVFVSISVSGMIVRDDIPSPQSDFEQCKKSCYQANMRTPESIVSDSLSTSMGESPLLQETEDHVDQYPVTFVPNYNLENEKVLLESIVKEKLHPRIVEMCLQLYSRENQKLLRNILDLRKELQSMQDGLDQNLWKQIAALVKEPSISQSNSKSSEPQSINLPQNDRNELLLFYISERRRLANRVGVLRKKIYQCNKAIKLFSDFNGLPAKQIDSKVIDFDELQCDLISCTPSKQISQGIDCDDLFNEFISLEPYNMS